MVVNSAFMVKPATAIFPRLKVPGGCGHGVVGSRRPLPPRMPRLLSSVLFYVVGFWEVYAFCERCYSLDPFFECCRWPKPH